MPVYMKPFINKFLSSSELSNLVSSMSCHFHLVLNMYTEFINMVAMQIELEASSQPHGIEAFQDILKYVSFVLS